MDTVPRQVRSVDVGLAGVARVADGIDALYDDRLDVIILRGALARDPLARTGQRLDAGESDLRWARPNEKMPVEDIQLLGTDTPATPTYQAPRGATLDAYLEGAARHSDDTSGLFDEGFDPIAEIERMLALFSGGRQVACPRASGGRSYVPFTLRRLTRGKQIGIHHDYHYPLSLYTELAPEVDTRTLVSWVVTLRRPTAGGELFVYGVTPDTPGAPKMPNGFQWDLPAIEQRYDAAAFTMDVGDLFLLASGRCLHRVNRVEGPDARVTLGGFLALDKARQRVLYWS